MGLINKKQYICIVQKIKFTSLGFLYLLVVGILMFAALNRHSHSKVFTYNSQLWADKAGYYIYLPALFIYDFDLKKIPDNIDLLTGNGFTINKINNKIESKYPVGTAILESPFFILANTYELLIGGKADGFSKTYQNMIEICAVFYLSLGLFYLFLFLSKTFSRKSTLLSLFVLFSATNLYYYSICEGGFSHIYSFFLFSYLLFLLSNNKYAFSKTTWFKIIIVGSFIVLIRQINIVFLIISLFIFIPRKTLQKYLSFKDWMFSFIIFLMVLSPQIIYNFYLSGSPFLYSYQNEKFIYLFNPKIKEVLFAFENGWITNNPIHLFTLIGIVIYYKIQPKISIGLLLIFLFCTYLYASWWSYELGCAYGHRGFVDIYPFAAISLTAVIQWIKLTNSKLIKKISYSFIILCVVLNLKFIYTYDTCWPNNSKSSDFEIYLNFLTSPTK